jgi:hypothetical protein
MASKMTKVTVGEERALGQAIGKLCEENDIDLDRSLMMMAIIMGQLIGDHIDSQENIERQLQVFLQVMEEEAEHAFDERDIEEE